MWFNWQTSWPAYLDCCVSGLDECVLKWHKIKYSNKKVVNVRSEILFELLQTVDLFSCASTRLLQNVFLDCTIKVLQCNSIDLLSIKGEGMERMFAYIRQYTLNPQQKFVRK